MQYKSHYLTQVNRIDKKQSLGNRSSVMAKIMQLDTDTEYPVSVLKK